MRLVAISTAIAAPRGLPQRVMLSRRAAARRRRHPDGCAPRDRRERWNCDDCGRDRRRWARRLHLSRRCDRGQHTDPRGRYSRRAARASRRRSPRLRGAETRLAATMKRVLLLALVLSGCAKRDRIVVGAKNFTESDLLAEIVAQHIERRTGLPVERRLHLGGTFVCDRAIKAGQIDLYVEYTGTAFTAILKQSPIADPDSVYRFVAATYARQFQLQWTAPLGFNNTFAILVRRADAERYGLRSIGDLARVAPRWKAGFGYEFLERADGFAGLAKVYGLTFLRPPSAMDLGLTYRALADHRVDVIAGNSTDGQIAALNLAVLIDDRRYFPPYQAAPIVRATTLEKYPAVSPALAELGDKISDAEMRRLNALADVEHKDIAEIARAWLAERIP